MRSTISV